MAPQPTRRLLALSALVAVAGTPMLRAQAPVGQATQRLTVAATFQPRVSLHVSSSVLQFDVTDRDVPATATLEFTAGARAASSDEVHLVIDALQEVPGILAIADGPEGVAIGELQSKMPTIAARWTGGGLRSGRLTFAFGAVALGRYSVPVSLRLTIS